jgi:TRAP-type C4-dicarboxylate transport system permease small subunit
MKILHVIEQFFVRLESALLVVFLSVMILLAFSQVILRNFFDSGLLWGDQLVRHLVLWVGFMGAAVATSEEKHISIDALTKFLSSRIRSIVHLLTNVFALGVCWYLAEAAFHLYEEEQAAGGTLVLDIPSWVGVVILPPGYLLIAFHFGVRVVHHFLAAAGQRESTAG